MREIGAEAFARCEQLARVQLNEGLERLGAKEIVGDLRYRGNVFASSAVRDVRLPSMLKTLEARTFFDCQNLCRIAIPSGVECIEEECFYEC